MKLHIKYMVSTRCKMLVEAELDKLELDYAYIELGEVQLKNPITSDQYALLQASLLKMGLELIEDRKAILTEKIRVAIVELIHYSDEINKVNFADYLSRKLGQPYGQLTAVFSEVTNTTIEQYVIVHKIERVKELLLYNDLTLKEISHRLNYSSLAHLSAQFKKITGMTPTQFKKLRQHTRRITLDSLLMI
jgi:AraC-like DNA-binding protein